MRKLALAALIALAILPAGGEAARATNLRSLQCAPGYHSDRSGNCQPDVRQVSRYCPPGSVYAPFPDGWVCNPAPRDAY